jgi:hypothetical protein
MNFNKLTIITNVKTMTEPELNEYYGEDYDKLYLYPEIRLHPQNIKLIAHTIAKNIKDDIRVVLITHSDFLVKELNILMMLYNYRDRPKYDYYIKKYKFRNVLNPDLVTAYSIDHFDIIELPKNEYGIEYIDFDIEIDNQNEMEEDIYWGCNE